MPRKQTERPEATCQLSCFHIKVKENTCLTAAQIVLMMTAVVVTPSSQRGGKVSVFFFPPYFPLKWKNPETNGVVRIRVAWILRRSLVASMFDVMHRGGVITTPTGRLTLWPWKHLCASVLTGSTSIWPSAVCSSQGAIRIYIKQETRAKPAD